MQMVDFARNERSHTFSFRNALCVFFHCNKRGKCMNENWYNQIIEDVEKNLETNAVSGLTDEQVIIKREKFGYNELKEGKKKSLFVKFLEQFKDFMVIVLIIAAIISFVGSSK
jgi:magnesium-transporting ATPase (P-type)